MDYYYGLVLFICCWIPGLGKLPPPINVTMDSFNFMNTLRWTQPADLEGDVMYIVEYKMDVTSNRVDYKTICITHQQQCLSSVITYRSYVRVKARKYSDESDWVTILFDPYEQTIIGAPDVTVSSRSGYLNVSFEGPLAGPELGSLKEKYGELIYRVVYWKDSDPARVLNVSTSQSQDTLRDLEAWTVYCVKVQAYVPEYDKAGAFSPVICKETTNNGSGKLSAPINVTMESINFRNTLRWKKPADLEGDVIYIVEYKMDVTSNRVYYKPICITHEQWCNSSVITYRSYVRVKARKYSDESDWVTIHFDPYEETIIGAPEMTVSSRSGYLDVSFEGPFVGPELGSLKEKYGEFIYRVVYWKESDPAHILNMNTLQSQDTLHDLQTWTVYCVKVQAYVPEYDKAGAFSPVICKETTDDGKTSSWKIAVLFLGAMVLSAVVILVAIFIMVKGYKIARYIFFPSYSFPEHLKEYLNNPFYNAPYLPPQPTEECGESCEQLTFISEETEEKNDANVFFRLFSVPDSQ